MSGSFAAASDLILIPKDIFQHPVVGAGKGSTRKKEASPFEAWMFLIGCARITPAQRRHGDEVLTLEPMEMLLSVIWVANQFRWTKGKAARFLKGLEETDMLTARPVLDGWKVHQASPFIVKLSGYHTCGNDTPEAHGNINLPLRSVRKEKDWVDAVAERVYQRVVVPMATRRAVYERDGYRCLECGKAARLSLDHRIPVASGGDNSIENLRTLCLPCNIRKGASLGGAA